MKHCLILITTILLFASCNSNSSLSGHLVKDINGLKTAIGKCKAGDEIIMANGVWKDVQIQFYGKGTESQPITLRAETPGQVIIEGQSYLHLGGEYLVVKDLYFKNGFSPLNGVIRYQIGEDSVANHTRVTECVIQDFSRPNRWENDRWVSFYGKHNQMDRCYISGKSNDGATFMVYHNGNKHTNSHHQIINNYFGPRPRKGGPRAETMRLGGSETSMTPGYVNVSDNYFEACNGEVEIISDKTNFNTFKNNIFYKCEGSLVLRHGNYTEVDGNFFIGHDDSDFYGGIRAVNTGHWITNNYFYKIKGEQFRGPLAVMNGIPKSPINRYKQVTDVVVAYNTWVDCKSPWQIGVGQNKESADILPISEIRSAPPIRTTIANNIIYNSEKDNRPIINHDDMSGILFQNNFIDNKSEYTEFDVLQNDKISMKQINDWLYVPVDTENGVLANAYNGYEFEKIEADLFGSSRLKKNCVGAVCHLTAAEKFKIDKKNYGPTWFTPNENNRQAQIFEVPAEEGQLQAMLEQAESGDVLVLKDDSYSINAPLKIDKSITIRSASGKNVKLVYAGAANTPLFEMNPHGSIHLQQINIQGQGEQIAFKPLAKNMSTSYKLKVENCTIDNFDHILKATTGSFADSIYFNQSVLKNCPQGFVLAADKRGDYNAEMVTFESCTFENIGKNLIHFFRGGYDESTIGGVLNFTKNTFKACGSKEKSGVLIKTHGIINFQLNDNIFTNNPVKNVAVLWGEKNNHHHNNTLVQSGTIKVEAQQKQEILY